MADTTAANNSNIMEKASQLNNDGAGYFAQGDWARALESFRSSLECMVAQVRNKAPPTAAPLADPGPSSSSPIAALHLPRRTTETGRGDDGSFFYQKAIVFEQIMPLSHETSLIFCAVVIFNMAVTAHKKGESGTGDSSAASLAKALVLYDSSIDFFARVPAGGSNHFFAGVVAAALNNKVRIYYQVDCFDELEWDSHRLSNAMFFATRQSESAAKILADGECEGILLNIMLLKRPHSARAA